jgi:copper chaperone CopZ
MESLTLKLPAMFADHHVIEVRRVLSELPGVGDIYASSAFLSAEIDYEPDQITPQEIEHALKTAGYLEALPIPEEIGAERNGKSGDTEKPFFRHTTAYAQAGKTVSFAQNISFAGRPLWPCPGLGLIEREEAEHA